MEIRGIGIIDVRAVYGIRAIRAFKRVEVEVNLQEWDDAEDYERLGLEDRQTTIIGIEVRQVIIPIFPGKNITVIAETIALSHMLKVYGIDAAKRLDQQLLDMMESDKKTRRYLLYDHE
ncbi:MAG: HPr kinase/phosphorylase, partial [Candidatus Krumholzibacteria bacterium]|nr:HPr kinase/phosphorylase [Candidatus Krumholzibacteria bacterium]